MSGSPQRMTTPLNPRAGTSPDTTGHTAPVISIRDLKSHCATCSMRELCLPVGLSSEDLKQVDSVIGTRVKLKKGESLYRAGEPFGALFAVPIASILGREILSETRPLTEKGFGICVGQPIGDTVIRIIAISDEPIRRWSEELQVPQGDIGEITVKGGL